MTRPAETSHEAVRGLVQLARRELLRSAAGQADHLKRETLIRAQRRALVQRRRYRWGAAALGLAAGVALLLRRPQPAAEARLAYTIRQSSAGPQTASSTRYEFADGTAISVGGDALLAVVSADVHTARVRLDRGDAVVKVVHRPAASWKFAAGPFEVTVVGTAFDLHWDPKRGDFALNLREGVVQITGPVLDGPLLLRAGHTLSVSIETGRVDITSQGAALVDSAASALPLPRPASTASVAATGTLALSAPAPSATAPTSWRVLVGRGRFAQVVSAAQALPLESCLASCSASDLRALADAARYSGRAGLAEGAFLALRRRFPGTPDAAVGAFLLGRTYEAEGRPELAKAWYEHYLAEAPGGQFAVEAESGRVRVLGTP